MLTWPSGVVRTSATDSPVVVDDVAEQIYVAVCGQRLEEAMPGEGATPVEILSCEVRPAALDGLRQVDQRSVQLRIGFEKRAQERPGATSDVDDMPRAGPVEFDPTTLTPF